VAEIDQIIQVQISRETQAIATASFQVPLILTEHTAFVERAKEYTDLEAVEVDFAVGSTTHTIASKVFGQTVRPPKIVIGRKAADPETYDQALPLVEQENNDWYCLICESHLDADILALAALIEARRKVYATATQDPDALLAATTDITGQLSDLGYERTFITYHSAADTSFPEAVWVGDQLPRVPGSNDWTLKSGSGLTADNLTDTERANLRSKNSNMYTSVAGVSVFQDGDMVSGKPIDEQILIDWTVSRMQEAIYFRLINSLKIPYTRAGFTIIENEMRAVLAQGVANGGFANNPAPTVTAPDPLTISDTLRAARTAGDFLFTARLAGSGRKFILKGTLTV